jgi:sulfur-oxidizing protein SoxY
MRRLVLLATLLCARITWAAETFDGVRWDTLRAEHFPRATIVLDARVKILAPHAAEDSMNVPIGVRIEGLPDVQEVRVLADYNPIVKALEFFPTGALPALTFRIKLQQTSPIRALARTKDGVWHMGVVQVEAAGGGCTAPSFGSGENWRTTLNQVQGKVFSANAAQPTRVRFGIKHPMDTGLAPGIPAFYLERLAVLDETGRELMRIHAFEPISENPVFSIDLPPGSAPTALALVGIDNQGNKVNAKVAQ